MSPSPTSADPPKAARSTSSSTCRAHAEGRGHAARGLDLPRVDLAVADGQPVERPTLALRQRRGGRRVEPAREQHDRAPRHHTPRVSGLQMYLCA